MKLTDGEAYDCNQARFPQALAKERKDSVYQAKKRFLKKRFLSCMKVANN
jgi:hypothetical protein